MRSWLVGVLAACAAAFAGLSLAVAAHPGPFVADLAALDIVERLQTAPLTAAMRAASIVGATPGIATIVMVVGGLAVLVRRDTRPHLWLAVTALGSIPMYQSLKALFDRARPPDGLVHATDAAFPSGHATQGVAFFGMLAVVALRTLRGPWRGVAAAAAIALGGASAISRVYLEVHWLTDVVGGCFLGGAWLCGVLLIRDAAERR